MKSWLIRSIVANVMWLAVGFIGLECLYRLFLYFKFPDRFVYRSVEKPIDAFNRPMWQYDPKFGYSYSPAARIASTSIRNGRVVSCHEEVYANEQGNIGPSVLDFPVANVRIVVFGDSFSASAIDGETWPSILQTKLKSAERKTVRVLNLGRDGYGVLQMFDFAAGKIEELRPTVVIFAFNSGTFAKERTWRVLSGSGDEGRFLSTKENSSHPTADASTDVQLLMPSATKRWCDGMLTKFPAEQARDDVLKRIVRKDEFLRWENRVRTANIWDPGHSYAYSRIVYNDQFHNTPYRNWVQRSSLVVPYDDFAQDSAFVRAAKAVNDSRVPYLIVNLPMGTEVAAGNVPVTKEPLARSLERITGQGVVSLLPYLSVERERAMLMCVDAARPDCHPNVFGMTEYAEAVKKLIQTKLPALRIE